jgi:hypothetical protein
MRNRCLNCHRILKEIHGNSIVTWDGDQKVTIKCKYGTRDITVEKAISLKIDKLIMDKEGNKYVQKK